MLWAVQFSVLTRGLCGIQTVKEKKKPVFYLSFCLLMMFLYKERLLKNPHMYTHTHTFVYMCLFCIIVWFDINIHIGLSCKNELWLFYNLREIISAFKNTDICIENIKNTSSLKVNIIHYLYSISYIFQLFRIKLLFQRE